MDRLEITGLLPLMGYEFVIALIDVLGRTGHPVSIMANMMQADDEPVTHSGVALAYAYPNSKLGYILY